MIEAIFWDVDGTLAETERDGVDELLEDCARAGLRMGIVTTTSRSNVEALLKTHLGKHWESRFAVVVCAQEAPRKKPDPQAYLLALEAMQLRPHEIVAIEDAPAVGPSLGRCAGWHPTAVENGQRGFVVTHEATSISL
jgi:beta-phosphoglucomutase-like phosphatase (HAD superfamily)